LRVLVTSAVLWHFRGHYPDLRGFWCSRGRGFGPALIIGVAAFALWTALEPRHTPADSEPVAAGLTSLGAGRAAWLVFRSVGSVLVVPLAEELAFRGFLTRRLIAADFTSVPTGWFTWTSFLISSVLFGVLHGRWIAGTLAGMLYAGAMYRRRSLADAVLAHATTNALITASVLATGSWSLWS
jgi:CAAX prenyl protease-like protein